MVIYYIKEKEALKSLQSGKMHRQIGFLISLLKQFGGRIFEKMLQEYGIGEFNGPQGRILYILWEQEDISIQELSQRSGLANATLTSMLDRMEAKKLVFRKADKHDRRKCLIGLTEKARSLKSAYENVSKRMTDIYYQGFSDSEIEQLEYQLRRLLENLRNHAENKD